MNTKEISKAVDFFHIEAIERLNADEFNVASCCMQAQEAAFNALLYLSKRKKKIERYGTEDMVINKMNKFEKEIKKIYKELKKLKGEK